MPAIGWTRRKKIEGSKLTEAQIKKIGDKLQEECVRQYGNNEASAKIFWYKLVHKVHAQCPEAVPVMINAQPDQENKRYMQGVYEELKCSMA